MQTSPTLAAVCFTIGAAVLVLASPAAAVVAIDGGMAPGTTIPIDIGPGDQTDPHVSGNLVAYTDYGTGVGRIGYRDFATAAAGFIPAGAVVDSLPNVFGQQISFSRQWLDRDAIMLFDAVTGSLVEFAPQAGSRRFASALGGHTLAFVDQGVDSGSILVGDVTAPAGPLTNLSQGKPAGSFDGHPAVAPDGSAVVWERCDHLFTDCWTMRALYAGGVWGAAEVVSDAGSYDLNADTDGRTVSYESARTAPDAQQLFWQLLGGGPESSLELPGHAIEPHISEGVIAFSHRLTNSDPTDLFVYVIATNMLYQVTDTPLIDEVLADISVLPGGDIRVVWEANADANGRDSIFASTFRVPLEPVDLPLPGTLWLVMLGLVIGYLTRRRAVPAQRLCNGPGSSGRRSPLRSSY
jgi:hypothetical protein